MLRLRVGAGLHIPAEGADSARGEGIAIAQEMVARIRSLVAGVQLSAPFGRYQMAIDVAEAIEAR